MNSHVIINRDYDKAKESSSKDQFSMFAPFHASSNFDHDDNGLILN